MPHKCYDLHMCQDVRQKKLGSTELRSLNVSLKAVGGVDNDGAGGVGKIRKTTRFDPMTR